MTVETVRQSLGHVALIVRDYDEAIAWFIGKLSFRVIADEYQAEQDKRWVVIAPPGAHQGATTLLLARAATPEQERFIGNQSGGRVFLFLRTDDFARALTSNLQRATEPGNVLLDVGEGELPKQSVVVVSQIDSVEKTQLRERIGALSEGRVQPIVDGLRFQQRSFFGQ